MMPGEREVLRQDELPIVADPASGRKRRCGHWEEIRTGAGRETKIPHFVRAKADATVEGRMIEINLSNAPRFGPRGEGGVFHFRGVVEPADGAGGGDAAGVARAPDNGKAQVLVGVISVVVLTDVPPIQKVIGLVRRRAVPDAGKILVRERRVDKWVLPGVVPRDPITNYGGELPDLEVDALHWGIAEKIFVHANLSAVVARIETAVYARLRKNVYLRPNLSVEEQGEPRIKKKVVVSVDESGSRLLDEIGLEIDESVQLELKTVLRVVQGKRLMDLFEKVCAYAVEATEDQRKNQRGPPEETDWNMEVTRHEEVCRWSSARLRW